MSLSVIIVNYNSGQLILNCLETFFNDSDSLALETIVVDTSSSVKDRNAVCSQFKNIVWIDMGYNAGFARANNMGIRHSKGDAVLLLNPDTLVMDNAIYKTYKKLTESNDIACGVQLLNEDGSPQISGNYAMKGGLNYLLPLPYVGVCIKWLGNLLKVKKPNVPDAANDVEVDWINGAFLMVKKNAIEKAGLLDEDFFLYAEEAEWCSRLKKVGTLRIYGEYKVIHLQGESANGAFNSEGKGYYNLYDKKGRQIMLSNFVRIRKQFGVFWFLLDLLIYTFAIPIFFVAGFFHHLFLSFSPFKHFTKAIGFSKNVAYLWKFSPAIIKNKPNFYKVL